MPDNVSTAPGLRFEWHEGADPIALLSGEWLVTNGLGGYASGTLLNVPTRRYHGLFVPDLPAPRGRTMMLPQLHEEVRFGPNKFRLDGIHLVDGRMEGTDSHVHLREFRLEWQVPSWRYDFEGRSLKRTVVMPYGQNTVHTCYTLLSGEPIQLALRPFPTFRMHDEAFVKHSDWPFTLTQKKHQLEILCFDGASPLKVRLWPNCGVFVVEENWRQGVLYPTERDRGYDHVEDLFSPGYFLFEMNAGESVSFVASTEPWETLELDTNFILEAERKRLERLVGLAAEPARNSIASQLVMAADQFIVLPGSRPQENILSQSYGEHVRTVIAGYHWFTDWGRDTMISLEGLTLCTGRRYEARDILRTFSHYVNEGLLPNVFPEGKPSAVYNTADATFWYFHAIDRYVEITGDLETLRFLFPTLKSIIEHHVKGTLFGIGMDPKDGLLRASAEGYQLTWMDAKVGGWVVTPRRGKPVEIQALWYNALKLMSFWSEKLGEMTHPFEALAKPVYESFNARFWNASRGCLYDVVDGEGGVDDPSLRPNQIFSISLRFPILDPAKWAAVIDVVEQKLLTPYGLRTLEPGHKDFRPHYEGDLWARDAAYHQGLVWAWLIGHFVDAWIKIHKDKRKAREFLRGFEEHLHHEGIGSISEIFDAEEPYRPRGCIAQAWSVAEVLRAYLATEP